MTFPLSFICVLTFYNLFLIPDFSWCHLDDIDIDIEVDIDVDLNAQISTDTEGAASLVVR